MKDYLCLENFWKRYNKVQLDKLSLDKEKQMLVNENTQLRMLIRQYLDGISVNSDVLSNSNPLLIVNNRTNARLDRAISLIIAVYHRHSSKSTLTLYYLLLFLSLSHLRLNIPVGNNMVEREAKVVIEAKDHLKNTIY
jgi:hypothetical protein